MVLHVTWYYMLHGSICYIVLHIQSVGGGVSIIVLGNPSKLIYGKTWGFYRKHPTKGWEMQTGGRR